MKTIKLILTICWAISVTSLFAQPTTDSTSQDSFSIKFDKEIQKKLDGDFTIESSKGISFVRGQYQNGKPSGDWTCYKGDGKVSLKYNFENDKLSFIDKKVLLSQDYTIDARNVLAKKDARVPLLISSFEYYKQVLRDAFVEILRDKVKGEGGEVTVKYTAYIDKRGNVKYVADYVLDHLSYNVVIFPEDKKKLIVWVPSTYNGDTYDAQASFSEEFVYNPRSYRRSRWTF